MTNLLVFKGHRDYTGVFQDSCQNLKNDFKTADPTINGKEVTAEKLIKSIQSSDEKKIGWEKKTIVVFPGGSPATWDGQFESDKIKKIREFVQRGGNIFLVCAGAFFSMEQSSYKLNPIFSIEKSRKLCLFPGKGIGPIDPKTLEVTLPDNFGSCIAVKDVATNEVTSMYFKGGGYFLPNEDAIEGKDYKVLHTYLDGKIASAASNVGEGKAIMTFFHPEYHTTPKFNDNADPVIRERFAQIKNQLKEGVEYRKRFYKICLNHFNKILPNDIWLKIFSYLEMSDLASVQLVCQDFNSIAKNDLLWENFAKKRDIQFINNEVCIKKIVLKSVILKISLLRPILNTDNLNEISNIFHLENKIIKKIKEDKANAELVLTEALSNVENLKDIEKVKILIYHGAKPNKHIFLKLFKHNISDEVLFYLRNITIKEINSNIKLVLIKESQESFCTFH